MQTQRFTSGPRRTRLEAPLWAPDAPKMAVVPSVVEDGGALQAAWRVMSTVWRVVYGGGSRVDAPCSGDEEEAR